MPPVQARSSEDTIRYLLTIMKSCDGFDPDFTKVAGEFAINTSRPGVDALVAPFSLHNFLHHDLSTLSTRMHPQRGNMENRHASSEIDILKFNLFIIQNTETNINGKSVAA